jgi:hypothetical protein
VFNLACKGPPFDFTACEQPNDTRMRRTEPGVPTQGTATDDKRLTDHALSIGPDRLKMWPMKPLLQGEGSSEGGQSAP